MRAIAQDELPLDQAFADEMSYCLGCLACQSACPAGVDYAELFETSRAEIELSGVNKSAPRSFWRWLTLEQLFMRPRLLRLVGRVLRFHQTSGLETLFRKSGLVKLLPANLRRLEPQAPRMSAKFSYELIEEIEEPSGEKKYRVAVLTGCVQDLAFAQINRDTVDVLLANNCEVHTPPVQPCCGSLHSHNGETELARENARKLLDLIDPSSFDAIISNAGGCGSHLRHYHKLLPDDPRALIWDARLKDVHEFLCELKLQPPLGSPFPEGTKATYHDSCHLAHGQKVTLQPRAIIDLIPGLERVNLPEADWCCGSAGVYSITQPEQSELLLTRKIAHIQSTGADLLLTANPGCHLQIAAALPELRVMHPISLLAQAYRQ